MTFRELHQLIGTLPEEVLDQKAIVVASTEPFEVFGEVTELTRGAEPIALGEIPDWVWDLKNGDNWPFTLFAVEQ